MLDRTDHEIVKLVQAGDKQAFNLLVSRHQTKVLNLISRYIRHSGDVNDIAQEAFIKAYRAIDSFRGDSQFYTWLYRIAINTAKNYLTAQTRKPPASDVEASDAEYFDGSDGLKENASPEHALITDELKRQIFSTISELPEELKAAITLREIDGLSYEEIAQIMDCPVGTVRSRIFRAREVLDKVIAPLLER